MTENQGIYVAGGAHLSINGGAVAAGPHAAAYHQVAAAPAADALQQVDAVLALIHRHRAALPDADLAVQVALKIRAELTAATPNRDRVTAAMSRLTARVAGVAALATAATGLDQAVHALVG